LRRRFVAAGFEAEPIGTWGLLVIGHGTLAIVGIIGSDGQAPLSNAIAGRLADLARLTAPLPVRVARTPPGDPGWLVEELVAGIV
jgi:hypothetical protein